MCKKCNKRKKLKGGNADQFITYLIKNIDKDDFWDYIWDELPKLELNELKTIYYNFIHITQNPKKLQSDKVWNEKMQKIIKIMEKDVDRLWYIFLIAGILNYKTISYTFNKMLSTKGIEKLRLQKIKEFDGYVTKLKNQIEQNNENQPLLKEYLELTNLKNNIIQMYVYSEKLDEKVLQALENLYTGITIYNIHIKQILERFPKQYESDTINNNVQYYAQCLQQIVINYYKYHEIYSKQLYDIVQWCTNEQIRQLFYRDISHLNDDQIKFICCFYIQNYHNHENSEDQIQSFNGHEFSNKYIKYIQDNHEQIFQKNTEYTPTKEDNEFIEQINVMAFSTEQKFCFVCKTNELSITQKCGQLCVSIYKNKTLYQFLYVLSQSNLQIEMPEYLPFGSFKISKIVETLKEDEETVGQYYLKQILSDFNNKNYLQYLFLIKQVQTVLKGKIQMYITQCDCNIV